MTFAKFYREQYLPRHAQPACRWLHLLGLPAAAAYGGVMAWQQLWWWLLLMPVPTYALAWLGHVVVGNWPTFFEHPLLSVRGYWKILGAMLGGELRGYTPGAGEPGAAGAAEGRG